MKSILVDLHNHLINKDSKFIKENIITRYFNLRTKYKCEKIIAFTDHYSELISNLDDYKKYFFKISKNANFKTLLGIEIDVIFSENSKKHLVIIFHKDFDDFEEFKKTIGLNLELNFNKIKNNENLFKFLNNNDKCFFFPHYGKSDKKRNFTIDELNEWNKLLEKNRVNCLDLSPNLKSYWFIDDDEKTQQYHCVVSTDRNVIGNNKKIEENIIPISSYIYVNDNYKQSDNYVIINDFFKQKETFSNVSYDEEMDFTLPSINYSFQRKNSLIFGKRGSGKTYLLTAFKNALKYGNNDQNNEICCIDQFEFSKQREKELKDKYLNKDYVLKQSNKYNNVLLKIFDDNLRNDYKIEESDFINCAKTWLEKFKEEFENIICENINDPNNNLKFLNDTYSFLNNDFTHNEDIHYKKMNEFIENYKKLINTLHEFKKDNHWNYLHKSIDELIKIFNNEQIKLLLKSLINEYKVVKIKEKNREIFNYLITKITDIVNWEYTFDKVNFIKYYKLVKIIEAYNNFLNEKAKFYIRDFENNPYSLKYELDEKAKMYKSLELVYKANRDISASDGQICEFLLRDKIFNEYKTAKYFILDEPEYAFDNKFIKEFSKEIINEISEKGKIIFVVTHNHIFWSEFYERLNDKTYIKCEYNGDKNYSYEQLTTDEFKNSILFKNFEVDEDSYNNRKKKYNIN